MPTNTNQNDPASGPAPMAAMMEVVRYAQSAVIKWYSDAATRAVSVIEHDSIIVGLLVMRDFFGKPETMGPPANRSGIVTNPYATVPYFNPDANNGAGAIQRIAAVGIYPDPGGDTEAAKWWRAIDAMIWRLADLTTEEPAAGAAVPPSDAIPVAVFGDDRDATITTPGIQFREHLETVRLMQPFTAGALIALDSDVLRTATTTAEQATARAAAVAVRDQLIKEREQVTARGSMRALGVLGLGLAGAYAYSKM